MIWKSSSTKFQSIQTFALSEQKWDRHTLAPMLELKTVQTSIRNTYSSFKHWLSSSRCWANCYSMWMFACVVCFCRNRRRTLHRVSRLTLFIGSSLSGTSNNLDEICLEWLFVIVVHYTFRLVLSWWRRLWCAWGSWLECADKAADWWSLGK